MTLAHTAITVKDMEASLRFYTEGLGLKQVFDIPRPETGEPWIVYLQVAKGQYVELFYGGETPNPWNEQLLGFNHLCFAVEDIHAAAARFEAAGYPMDIQPNEGCDTNWQSWITDPNGVRIELMQISPTSPHAKADLAAEGR